MIKYISIILLAAVMFIAAGCSDRNKGKIIESITIVKDKEKYSFDCVNGQQKGDRAYCTLKDGTLTWVQLNKNRYILHTSNLHEEIKCDVEFSEDFADCYGLEYYCIGRDKSKSTTRIKISFDDYEFFCPVDFLDK